MTGKVILRLEKEIRALEKGLCDAPPQDYAKFLQIVGRRNGLLQAIDIINEITKEQDERD